VHLRRKRFDRADETRHVPLARIDLVELGEAAIGKAVFEPGWRWSTHLKDVVGTESCEVHHVGFVISGRVRIEMNDGASIDLAGGDAFEIPPGHDAWVVGDEPFVTIDFAGDRLFAIGPQTGSQRTFATIVFTDLSGSTEALGRMGDTKWRTLLADHNQAAKAQIERYAGRVIQTTGDGFYLLFASPVDAVRAASALIDVADRYGLVSRAGVHTGEVERNGDDVRGIAVHLAARVLSVARPGTVVTSSTVRDLVSGSGLRFEDLGEFELKGIDGSRRLSALVRD
jgi:class 3 adenylate cyclase